MAVQINTDDKEFKDLLQSINQFEETINERLDTTNLNQAIWASLKTTPTNP